MNDWSSRSLDVMFWLSEQVTDSAEECSPHSCEEVFNREVTIFVL